MTDTSPKRLRELADDLDRFASGMDSAAALRELAAEKENPGPVCPTCGSDCNERDELIKAEREIEKLRDQVTSYSEALDYLLGALPQRALEIVELLKAKEAQPSPADVPLPEPPIEMYVRTDEHPEGIPYEQWADVPLPEGELQDHDDGQEAWRRRQIMQYGQACARAARDAAFNEDWFKAFAAEKLKQTNARERFIAYTAAKAAWEAKKGTS